VDVAGAGMVEEDGPRFTYRGITLRPRIVVTAEATDDQVALTLALARKADTYCLVTNAVRASVDIGVEPEVLRDVLVSA
jgi:organic hydroperoxide reductase OsmC/OhrA